MVSAMRCSVFSSSPVSYLSSPWLKLQAANPTVHCWKQILVSFCCSPPESSHSNVLSLPAYSRRKTLQPRVMSSQRLSFSWDYDALDV